jgi:hypothetical protein
VERARRDAVPITVEWKDASYDGNLEDYFDEPFPDLALLGIAIDEHPCVYLGPSVKLEDSLYTYGYTESHPRGEPTTFKYEGSADDGDLLKLKDGQGIPGLSGSPLLNRRAGHVCGVLKRTRDRRSDLGGFAIPHHIVLENLPALEVLQNTFHEQHREWTALLPKAEVDPAHSAVERYRERFATGWTQYLETLRRRPPRFTLTLSHAEENGVPVTGLLNFALNNSRVVLQGRAGAGKTTVMLALVNNLLAQGYVPFFVDVGRWKQGFSEELNNARTQAELTAQIRALAGASVADFSYDVARSFPEEVRQFVIVDGLNQTDGDTANNILKTLDDWVKEGGGRLSVIVSDRIIPRSFPSELWKTTTLEPLSDDEVRTHVGEMEPPGDYDVLADKTKSLLRIPYFLDLALSTGNLNLESEATAIQRFFSDQVQLEDVEIDRLAKAAFELYAENNSISRAFTRKRLVYHLSDDWDSTWDNAGQDNTDWGNAGWDGDG